MGLDSLFLMRPAKGWYVHSGTLPDVHNNDLNPFSLCQYYRFKVCVAEVTALGSRMLTSLHFGLRRSDYRTPVKGLYLCGSGAHPGGGVMGAPGRNAASVVLEDLIKAKK
jgi:hypothetical protein